MLSGLHGLILNQLMDSVSYMVGSLVVHIYRYYLRRNMVGDGLKLDLSYWGTEILLVNRILRTKNTAQENYIYTSLSVTRSLV